MRTPARRTWSLCIAVTLSLPALGLGCNAIGGIKEGVLIDVDDGGGADVTLDTKGDVTHPGDGAGDATHPGDGGAGDTSVGDTGVSEGAALDGGGDASACSQRTVDDATGIFVRTGSTDTSTCGDRTSPCGTVQNGITQAKLLGKTTVYVARGTYPETVTLQPGVTVEGAWDVLVTDWQPVCGTDELSTVTLQAPATSNVTVVANAGGGATGLRLLTVASKTTALAGETLYGVMATGGAEVTLDTVVVSVAAGGTGNNGDGGAPGSMGATGCVPSTGATGGAGVSPPATASGTFSATGYQASSGTTASAGKAGNAGTCTINPPCVTVCNFPTCSETCSSTATTGCGGNPGGGGFGGQGGGSSVAIFEWNAQVTVLGGSVTAGNGGNGGTGGTGAQGGNGGSASSGLVNCISSCSASGCATVGDQTAEVEAAGGAGGPGGQGSGGAGGSSFAIYLGGDAGAVTTQGAPLLGHGTAGTGGLVGGPAGQAGNQGP